MPDYHFTLELAGVTADELAAPIDKLTADGYDPVLGDSYERPALTIVVQATTPWQAVDVASDALDVLPGKGGDQLIPVSFVRELGGIREKPQTGSSVAG